jgi:hypothetical protein
VSENGNPMIVMRLTTPDNKSIQCTITFVERARRLINCFCESAQLIRPPGEGAQVELTAASCHNRYVYATIINDVGNSGDDPVPRITRFLTREQALIKSPALAAVKLQPQEPVVLPVLQPTPRKEASLNG